MAVLPMSVTSHAVTWFVSKLVLSVDAPASGSRTRVFRPPRALG